MTVDYRDILSEYFQIRRKINPRYSLRAFARDINMSPSRLSEVITGKGDLSREKAEQICAKLQLPPIVAADFIDLVEVAVAPMESSRTAALRRVKARRKSAPMHIITNDQFEIIADPKYLLIWTLMSLPAYTGCPEYIAKNLNMDLFDVFSVLLRLEQLKLVKRENGAWLFVKGQFSVGDRLPSEVIRRYHDHMAALGRDSIHQQSMCERHLDSIVIPFDSSRLGEVKQRIANFAQSLIDDFGVGGDSVYGMSLQFFRMTQCIESKAPAKSSLH